MCHLLHSPAIPPGLPMCQCGAVGSARSRTACPMCSIIRQVSGSGPPGLSMRECGAVGSASSCTACPVHSTVCQVFGSSHVAASPVHPGCPSPPLLPVWINVSSSSPWLLDFRVVRFSVSSGCFLFLNCCCLSFGCVKRRSVSTYASILVHFRHFCISTMKHQKKKSGKQPHLI